MKLRIVLITSIVAAACGGGDTGTDPDGGNQTNDVTPMLIPGGGVSSGAVAGEINIHVIDDETGAAVANASVRIGDAGAAAPLHNATDGAGLAVFIEATLRGPQVVTVSAPGYAAATWVGVNGANVTIPLARSPRATVPHATASGTIAGWGSLPAPDFSHYLLAVVLYSWSPQYGARENTLAQPMNGDTPANLCIRTALDGATCNWQMNTRTGRQIHYAVIVEGNTRGTPDDATDDTYELVGYALADPVELSAGQNLNGETLTITNLAQTTVSVQFPSPPAGASELLAFPFIDAGADGQLVFPLPILSPSSTTTAVPALTGPFAQLSYSLIGLAVPAPEVARPYAVTFVRGLSFAGTEPAAPFLPLPTGVSAAGDTYSFSPVPGASFHTLVLADDADQPVWTVVILNGAPAVTLPALSPDPRAGKNLELRVTATELPGFDPADFAIRDFAGQLSKVSEAGAPL